MKNADHSSNYLVLSLASGYQYSQLRPFITTLLESGYKGSVVCFVNRLSAGTVKKLSDSNIITVEYKNEYPFFAEPRLANLIKNPGKKLSPNSLRYFLYDAYLKFSGKRYDFIIHTDIRDVIFQKNPFDFDYKQGIYCFYEDGDFKIKDSKHNSFWIKHGFGDAVFEEIKNKPISCSGFTIASYDGFFQYLNKMIFYLSQFQDVGGLDQGIHNYLLNFNKLDLVHEIADDAGPISTISSFKSVEKIKINDSGLVLDAGNNIINIVHQYDRHWRLLWKYNKKEYFKKKINLIKRFFFEAWTQKKISAKMLKNLRLILFGKKIPSFLWK